MKNETMITSPNPIYGDRHLEKAIEIGPKMSQSINDEESGRRLSRTVFNSLREAGFFRMFLPASLGGIEADPLTTAKVVEEIALHNTAAAWCLMVANTATWWCSRLSDEGIEEIYQNGRDTFIAGAFHPPMRATPAKGGYMINGRSPLTSNVHEAHWIFVTAFVINSNNEINVNNGIPEIIGVFMNSKDCKILDTWHTLGMRATDSNDIEAKEVFVRGHLTYPLKPTFEPNRHYRGPLYQFPAIGASIASLIAPVALAVGRNAINEIKTLAEKKVPFGSMVPIRDKGTVQRKLGMAEAFVQSSRTYLHQTIADLWKKTLAGESLSLEDKAKALLSATHTNQTCFQAVDLMYSAAGTSGIYIKNKLAHYFTDAQVIRQHGFANESRYETAAQVYLGLQPDLPVIAF